MTDKTSPAPGFVLRSLTRADLRELVALERELFGRGAWPYDVIDAELHTPERYYVGAVAPSLGPIGVDAVDKLVGYAGVALGTTAEVMTVGVAARAQGRGIGRALMTDLIAACFERGAEEIFLEVRVDNDSAIHLYRSLGFKDVRIRRGYYQPENIDALVMRRK